MKRTRELDEGLLENGEDKRDDSDDDEDNEEEEELDGLGEKRLTFRIE